LRSAHQNDLKTSKTYYFKAKKKIQIFSEALLKSSSKQALKQLVKQGYYPNYIREKNQTELRS
jgi:hypothetical protein